MILLTSGKSFGNFLKLNQRKRTIRLFKLVKKRDNMDNNLILKAAHFAAQKHRDQRRKDREASPYINHPLRVAVLLSDIGQVQDEEILAAALLHDTIEDTDTKAEDIEKLFGARILNLVQAVSDDKSLPKEERKRRQIEHATELSPDAALIKLGDKISNVIDVTDTPPDNWSLGRRREYFDWAESVVNNLPKTNLELEDYFRKVVEAGRKKLLN
jgi:guanosine-3',5'-bis(diphosphate) 3'-pyrophosphohydrolase